MQAGHCKKEAKERWPLVFVKPSAQVKDEIAAAKREEKIELYVRIG
jgi:hypothetical protein